MPGNEMAIDLLYPRFCFTHGFSCFPLGKTDHNRKPVLFGVRQNGYGIAQHGTDCGIDESYFIFFENTSQIRKKLCQMVFCDEIFLKPLCMQIGMMQHRKRIDRGVKSCVTGEEFIPAKHCLSLFAPKPAGKYFCRNIVEMCE